MLNIQTLFNKILHGDFGLVKSFWIYGILSSYLLILLLMPLLIYFNSTLLSIIFSLTIVTYIAIQIIGIWRAAEKYTGAKIWGILARVVIILYFFGIVIDIYNLFL
jgi:hypothetical protein